MAARKASLSYFPLTCSLYLVLNVLVAIAHYGKHTHGPMHEYTDILKITSNVQHMDMLDRYDKNLKKWLNTPITQTQYLKYLQNKTTGDAPQIAV
jgi:hypothetical protein